MNYYNLCYFCRKKGKKETKLCMYAPSGKCKSGKTTTAAAVKPDKDKPADGDTDIEVGAMITEPMQWCISAQVFTFEISSSFYIRLHFFKAFLEKKYLDIGAALAR